MTEHRSAPAVECGEVFRPDGLTTSARYRCVAPRGHIQYHVAGPRYPLDPAPAVGEGKPRTDDSIRGLTPFPAPEMKAEGVEPFEVQASKALAALKQWIDFRTGKVLAFGIYRYALDIHAVTDGTLAISNESWLPASPEPAPTPEKPADEDEAAAREWLNANGFAAVFVVELTPKLSRFRATAREQGPCSRCKERDDSR